MRGVVPQMVRAGAETGEVRLMFRPAAVYRNATVVVRAGERELARRRSLIMAPGEMAVIPLKADAVASLGEEDITVSIETEQRREA